MADGSSLDLLPEEDPDVRVSGRNPISKRLLVERQDLAAAGGGVKGTQMIKLVIALLLVAVAYSQETIPSGVPRTPVADATRRWLQEEATHLIAAAERMPADKYDFQPSPKQMTFARLMTHIVESNRYMCSAIAGEPLPRASGVTASDGKDQLVADLRASFDYCTRALSKVDDSRLAEEVPLFKHTRADLMMFLIADHADHYATAAMHLRLNGLLPPTAKPQN